MRTTINVSDSVIKETQELYDKENRSNAIELALKDAIRYKKLQKLMQLKGKIEFDEEYLEKQRRAEVEENKNNS